MMFPSGERGAVKAGLQAWPALEGGAGNPTWSIGCVSRRCVLPCLASWLQPCTSPLSVGAVATVHIRAPFPSVAPLQVTAALGGTGSSGILPLGCVGVNNVTKRFAYDCDNRPCGSWCSVVTESGGRQRWVLLASP